jgi:hypothetical protein
MRGLIEHHLGMRVDGQIGRFANGGMTEEEFAELTRRGLPKGWVAWHAGTVNPDALRKVPLVEVLGAGVPRTWILDQLRQHIAAADGPEPWDGAPNERWPESHDYAFTDSERFGME